MVFLSVRFLFFGLTCYFWSGLFFAGFLVHLLFLVAGMCALYGHDKVVCMALATEH